MDILEKLDHPAVNSGIFFPRTDPGFAAPPGSIDTMVDVGKGVKLSLRFHPAALDLPVILHFHGNGEIAADYDDIAPIYHATGCSVAFADFRGYGRSNGNPSVRSLVSDAHPVFDAVVGLLRDRGHTGKIVLMGRSLGSACAIDLASTRGDEIMGLIVESGFARTLPLLGLLGITASLLGLDRVEGDDNEDKMARVKVPTLILHADDDMIVPPWHAERNYERCGSTLKRLVVIPDADHNTIIAVGGSLYWGSIATFLSAIA